MDTEQKKKPGLPSRLTPMQMKFAELLIYFEGRKFAYECAIEAGYSKDTARSQASQLQNAKLYPHVVKYIGELKDCLLYTSPSPRDGLLSRMPSSA